MANIYRVVKDSDGRDIAHIVKEETAPDPQFIVDLQAANTGSTIQTLTEEQGSTIEIGRLVEADGTVSIPSTETTNELLEGRRDRVGEWIQGNGGTVGFVHYATFVNEAKAKIYEAIQRMAYLHTHENTVLQTEAHWNKLTALIAIDWTSFVSLVDSTDPIWTEATLNGMRAGTTWRLITLNGDGEYVPTVDPNPPSYTTSPAHHEAYEALLASVRAI